MLDAHEPNQSLARRAERTRRRRSQPKPTSAEPSNGSEAGRGTAAEKIPLKSAVPLAKVILSRVTAGVKLLAEMSNAALVRRVITGEENTAFCFGSEAEALRLMSLPVPTNGPRN